MTKTLDLSKISEHWVQDGENNGHPKWRLTFYDFTACVYNSWDNKLWTAVLNQVGSRGYESEAAAKGRVEELITARINGRLEGARDLLATFEPPSTQEALREVLTGLVARSQSENLARTQDELKATWYFKYDDLKSEAWNLYEFTKCLQYYSRLCREWETHHNGSCCVVERVRDTYLMPEIDKFLSSMDGDINAQG